MEKEIRAVIFDQDGLMFDTERLAAEAWNLAGKDFGIVLDEAFLCTIRGMNRNDAKERFYQSYGEQVDFECLREKKWEYFRKLRNDRGLPVKPGLRELLSYLSSHSYKIAIATASTRDYTRENLKEAGIEEFFPVIASGDMVTRAKPDPELFLCAADLLGEKPENCMVLEDSLNGVEAGIAGGFCTVMVPDLTQPGIKLKNRVFAVKDSLYEVMYMLEEEEQV